MNNEASDSRIGTILGLAFGAILLVAGGAYSLADYYVENFYVPSVLDSGYARNPRFFGQMKGEKMEGWWFETFRAGRYPVRVRSLGVRYIFESTQSARAAPRPKSLGIYRGGVREGMWLFWEAPSTTTEYPGAFLYIDQTATGLYRNGVKTGPFVAEEYAPFVEEWEWPPVVSVLDPPWYIRPIVENSSLVDPYVASFPDSDDFELVEGFDYWMSDYERQPWRCLTVAPNGDVMISQIASCGDIVEIINRSNESL